MLGVSVLERLVSYHGCPDASPVSTGVGEEGERGYSLQALDMQRFLITP
jgi:hypothetical protein